MILKNWYSMKKISFISFFGSLSLVFSAKIHDGGMDYYTEVKEALLNQGHTFTNSLDSCDLIPFWSSPHPLDAKYRQKAILYTYEPPIYWTHVNDLSYLSSFLKACTWRHDLCEKNPVKYKKFFYPQYSTINYEEMKQFNNRKFACLISSYLYANNSKELYSKRKEIAIFYNKYFPKLFSLYGWRGFEELKLKFYKGVAQDKSPILADHKFCYCYENWDNDFHYITEKILDCISNLCVPIYLGSKNITDYIPEDVFIDARKFNSIGQIHTHLSKMKEETWNSYIEAMKRFDKSEKSSLFTRKTQAQRILNNALEALDELGFELNPMRN